MASPPEARVDLHVHSHHSNRPSEWILKKIGSPECYTKPRDLYRIAKARGMTFVTVTDHNVIDGGLEIAHHHDVFLSEEVDVAFPEDGCKIHVVTLGITEAQHAEIQRLRRNVYDLTAYLQAEGIAHFVAHPLYNQNGRLTVETFEKMLVLFPAFEVRNGARNRLLNDLTERIITGIGGGEIARLADKHGIAPAGEYPFRRGVVGGSDDHGQIHVATAYTWTLGAGTIPEFLDAVRNGQTQPAGDSGSAVVLAHSIYSVAFRYYMDRLGVRPERSSNPLIASLPRLLYNDTEARLNPWAKLSHLARRLKPRKKLKPDEEDLLALLREELRAVFGQPGKFKDWLANGAASVEEHNARIFGLASRLSSRILFVSLEKLVKSFSSENPLKGIQAASGIAAIYAVLSPYFFSFSHQYRDRRLLAEVQARFNTARGAGESVLFCDNDALWDASGLTPARLLGAREEGVPISIFTCSETPEYDEAGLKNFPAAGSLAVAESKVHFPPVLEVLAELERRNPDRLAAWTAGPMGLTALLAAQLLDLPLTTYFHTDLPALARFLTRDADIEELVWKYIAWFHGKADTVIVPTAAAKAALTARGLEPRRIEVRAWASPWSTNGTPQARGPALGDDEPFRLVSAGPIDRERGTIEIVSALESVRNALPGATLVLCGEGPMAAEARGLPGVEVVPPRSSAALASLFARADLFLTNDRGDLTGLETLRALSAGLPALVPRGSAAAEHVQPDRTGLLHDGTAPSIAEALRKILADPAERRTMGDRARRHAQEVTIGTLIAPHRVGREVSA